MKILSWPAKLMVGRVKTKSDAVWTKIQRIQKDEILNKNTKKYKTMKTGRQSDNETCRFSGRYFYQPVTTLSLPSKPNLHQICLKNPIFWREGNATPVLIYVICIMIQPWQWPWPCQRSDSAWPPSGIFSNNGFYVPLLIMQYASSTGEWPNPRVGGLFLTGQPTTGKNHHQHSNGPATRP